MVIVYPSTTKERKGEGGKGRKEKERLLIFFDGVL
jgi:hypothetical protein